VDEGEKRMVLMVTSILAVRKASSVRAVSGWCQPQSQQSL